MQYLKQSTAVTLKIGPCIDDTDGKTPETGLTIAQADVRLSKNGGNIAQKNEAASCTHDELGIYGCPIDTTDTATLGRLQLWVHESGALPVWHEYMVLPANVYDSMFNTDKLEVDLLRIHGSALTETVGGYLAAAFVKLFDVATPLLVASTAMKGTDNAALASICTEARLAELAAANLPADVDTILAYTNELQGDWANGGRLDLLIDAIKAETDNLPSGLQKNVALSNFSFLMTDSTTNEPKTGLTVTVQISKDGGAFANATNTPATEIANGAYKINLTQAEMNAEVIIFKATATGANQTTLVFVTST